MGADHVVVLADGHVAEEGTPEQLMERGGMFRHMVELQRESSNWQVGATGVAHDEIVCPLVKIT